ncbi:MAG: Hsp20 family protein [Pseudomonadota bacterium]
MKTIDLTPLYRHTVGYDRLASLLDSTLRTDSVSAGYPPYNIEVTGDERYAIEIAVAGFAEGDLEISVEKGVLTVRGRKGDEAERKFLHRGIANRTFERKFTLADYVEVVDAALNNGLLTISLRKELPEAMKPRTIAINGVTPTAIEGEKAA